MKLKIKTIYGITCKAPVAYEFHPEPKHDDMDETIRAQQPETDIAVIQSLLGGDHDNYVHSDAKLFVRVTHNTLAYRDLYQRWCNELAKLVELHGKRVVIQIGSDIAEQTLSLRWPEFKKLGAELAMSEFGTRHSRLDRLRRYQWQYCNFDAGRTVRMLDATALIVCRRRGVMPIARSVHNQSQSILSMLSGQDWQQGEYLQALAMNRKVTEVAGEGV